MRLLQLNSQQKKSLQQKAWLLKNTQKLLIELPIYRKKYNQLNKNKKRNENWKYKQKNHEKVKKQNRQNKHRLFEILGGAKCKRCGFSDERALQLDHIISIGRKKRKTTTELVRLFLKNPKTAPQKLQVLCANCNWIKRYENNESVINDSIIFCNFRRFLDRRKMV